MQDKTAGRTESPSPAPSSGPPVALARPLVSVLHGIERIDEYSWLRDRSDPEVIALLEAENAHTAASLAHTKPLQETLFEEMRGRIKETDTTAPVRHGPYHYYARTEEGLQYRIYCRRRADGGPEEVLLDHNRVAEGHVYCGLGPFEVSPDHRLLAYGIDATGDERFTLHVVELATGEPVGPPIPGAARSLAWAPDSETFFSSVADDAHRPYRLIRRRVGAAPREGIVVFEEPDAAFYLSAFTAKTLRYLVLSLETLVTTEIHVLDLSDPEGPFRLIAPRRHGIEYHLRHQGEQFLIWTNEDAKDFRLFEAPTERPEREHWREILPHRPGMRIERIEPFREFVAIHERRDGLPAVRILDTVSGEEHEIGFPEPTFALTPVESPEYDTRFLRFRFSSPLTPESVYDYDMRAREMILRKRQEIPSGHDPARYRTARLHATAPDGTQVPISIVVPAEFPRDGSRPFLLYGYGAYGASIDATFSIARLSLLDRGIGFGIAHVRGGGELGEAWREGGKLERKTNTFTDFIACAEHLIAEGYTRPERLLARGGSAGGLLIGAVVNLRPDLFRAVVADVPFVDIVNTVLDETLLYSVLEYDEWGNPSLPEQAAWMLAYSPYDNIRDQEYPSVLALGGLHDPRVNFWEPAKWIARLRARARTRGRLLLHTDMVAGHAGPSGRYDLLREEAMIQAFLLDEVRAA